MAIEVKKYTTPIMNNGEPCTFPTFADQVFLEDGSPLEKQGKINISPEKIGAANSEHTHNASDVGAAEVSHTHSGMYTTGNLVFTLQGETLIITCNQ